MTQFSTEDVEASMANILRSAGFDVNDDATAGDGSPDATGDGAHAVVDDPSLATTAPAVLTLADGRTITVEDAERWANFEGQIQDPRFQRAYQEAYGAPNATIPNEQQPAPAVQAADQMSEELRQELELNPVARYLYEQNAELRKQQADLATRVGTVAETQQMTEQRNAYSLVNQARANFAKEHKVSDADMERIYNTTLNLYDLDRLVTLPVNPWTNQVESPDPVRRIEEAFTNTFYGMSDLREADYVAKQEAAKGEAERKAKLTALGTSGSSAPPPTPTPAPQDVAGRRAALRDEIAAIQSGSYIQPE